jgi:hypothetical protein
VGHFTIADSQQVPLLRLSKRPDGIIPSWDHPIRSSRGADERKGKDIVKSPGVGCKVAPTLPAKQMHCPQTVA